MYPAAFHDSVSATQWVLDNKQKLFGSSASTKVGVAGDSAGGNLAAAVTHELKDKLDFQILIYPFVDLTCGSKSYEKFNNPCFIINYEAATDAARKYIGDKLEANSSLVSPIFNTDFAKQPKALIILAELDPLVEEGKEYHKKLQNANVSSELQIVQGAIHAFFTNNGLTINAFKTSCDHIIEFFKSF